MNEQGSARHVVAPFTEGADEETAQMIRRSAATMTPEELCEELSVACGVLDGLVVVAEAVGWATYTALSDARSRARDALDRAEALRASRVSTTKRGGEGQCLGQTR